MTTVSQQTQKFAGGGQPAKSHESAQKYRKYWKTRSEIALDCVATALVGNGIEQ